MKPSDLVRVKDGCGMEGRVGVILSEVLEPPALQGIKFHDILFFDGIVSISTLWLEVIDEEG